MYNRLKFLFELQSIDDQLDELEELRGDLPNAVTELEEQINAYKKEIATKEEERKNSLSKRKDNEKEITKLLEDQKKFKAQLYKVRNNKEYDALTKEIDHAESQMKTLEKENDQLAEFVKKLAEEIEEITPKLDELTSQLKEKEKELKEIIKSNEREESKLLKARSECEKKIKKADYSAYTRIRKAKNGKAVATIRRSACSGCQNIVPSQRQLEIRQNDRLFYCEHCGRILVSAEIADDVSVDK